MMYPEPGESLDRVVAAETAVSDLYRVALTVWAPMALSAALPSFEGAVVAAADDMLLPPDPAAVAAGTGWSAVVSGTVLAGVGALFAAAVVEAMAALGVPLRRLRDAFRQESAGNPLVAPRLVARLLGGDLGKRGSDGGDGGVGLPAPSVPGGDSGVFPQESATFLQVAPDVLEVVDRAVALDHDELVEAMALVDQSPALAAARDRVVAAVEADAAGMPERVARKTRAAVASIRPDENGAVSLSAQRDAVAAVLDPAGETMSGLTEGSWHLAAAVQNQAVHAAAQLSEDADELEKVWICTLDGKTRPTHWAADGARVALNSPFIVGGEPLQYPADPSGSPAETANCRCRMGILGRDEPLPDEVDRHTERLNGRDSVVVHREGRSQEAEIRRRAEEGNTRARDNRDGQGTVAAALPEGDPMDRFDKVTDAREPETYLTFTNALFAVTGVPTDDRRMLHADIELKMRDFPMPLQWQEKTGDGHKGSVTVGVIEAMRYENGEIRGDGYMLNNEHALKALELIQHGVAAPSIDMADATAGLAFADGTEVTEQNYDPNTPVFETYKKGTITAATIVAIPAFGQTRLSLNAEREPRSFDAVADGMAAAAAFEQPAYDPALFAEADPNLLKPHRLRMDPDTGRVHGFIATWKDQHRSVGLGHIRPPRSATNYEHFHTSPGVHLTDGRVLPVGRLTVGIGHAPTRGVSAAAAQAHYDNVDTCWALGRISEHRLGIYFSGVVAPWASPEKVQMGLASPVSGDWRPIGPNRNLELVAVLSVNTPGFLCKIETDEAGEPLAMVASLTVDPVEDPTPTMPLSLADIRAVMEDVLAEREQAAVERAAQAEMAARLESTFNRTLDLLGPPPTPTERMAAALSAYAEGEFARRVRNADYWGVPVGTPIRAGMKPRGKKRGGASGRAAEARANARQRSEDEHRRNTPTNPEKRARELDSYREETPAEKAETDKAAAAYMKRYSPVSELKKGDTVKGTPGIDKGDWKVGEVRKVSDGYEVYDTDGKKRLKTSAQGKVQKVDPASRSSSDPDRKSPSEQLDPDGLNRFRNATRNVGGKRTDETKALSEDKLRADLLAARKDFDRQYQAKPPSQRTPDEDAKMKAASKRLADLSAEWESRHPRKTSSSDSEPDAETKALDEKIAKLADQRRTARGDEFRRLGEEIARLREQKAKLAKKGMAAERTAEFSVEGAASRISGLIEEFVSRQPAPLKRYWLAGAGAAKIRWGQPGDFDRCRKAIQKEITKDGRAPLPPHMINGLCANLHREATGAMPGKAPTEIAASLDDPATAHLVPVLESFGWKVRKPGVYWHPDGRPAMPGEEGYKGMLMSDPKKKAGGAAKAAPKVVAKAGSVKPKSEDAEAGAAKAPEYEGVSPTVRRSDHSDAPGQGGVKNSGRLTDAEEAEMEKLTKVLDEGGMLSTEDEDRLEALERKSRGAKPAKTAPAKAAPKDSGGKGESGAKAKSALNGDPKVMTDDRLREAIKQLEAHEKQLIDSGSEQRDRQPVTERIQQLRNELGTRDSATPQERRLGGRVSSDNGGNSGDSAGDTMESLKSEKAKLDKEHGSNVDAVRAKIQKLDDDWAKQARAVQDDDSAALSESLEALAALEQEDLDPAERSKRAAEIKKKATDRIAANKKRLDQLEKDFRAKANALEKERGEVNQKYEDAASKIIERMVIASSRRSK
ncbi:capsid maturation protease and MuF-like fusion protein [Mycobacterium phage GodPhather]|nr:capsid maturation protease and MuF-like fusion protein [Mycobacterium phage GodPhather]